MLHILYGFRQKNLMDEFSSKTASEMSQKFADKG